MTELILALIQPLVEKPAQVNLRQTGSARSEQYILEVDRNDIGRVIGRDGKTIKAIRNLLSVAASLRHSEINLEIVERKA